MSFIYVSSATDAVCELVTMTGVEKVFLGTCNVGDTIVTRNEKLDHVDGDNTYVNVTYVMGVITELEHCSGIPTSYIRWAMDGGETRHNKPNWFVWK